MVQIIMLLAHVFMAPLVFSAEESAFSTLTAEQLEGYQFEQSDSKFRVTPVNVGQQAILAVRAKAELALGEQFDSRLFHEALLSSGAMPLAILEWNIDQWIAQQKAK